MDEESKRLTYEHIGGGYDSPTSWKPIGTKGLSELDDNLSLNLLGSALEEFKQEYPSNIKKDAAGGTSVVQTIVIPTSTNLVAVRVKSKVAGGTIQAYVRGYKEGTVFASSDVLIFRSTKADEEYVFNFKNLNLILGAKPANDIEVRFSLLIGETFWGEFEVIDVRFYSVDSLLVDVRNIRTDISNLEHNTIGDTVHIEIQGNDANTVGHPLIPLKIGARYFITMPTDIKHENFSVPSGALISIREFTGESYTDVFILLENDPIPDKVEFTATTSNLSIYIRADKGTSVKMSIINADADSISLNSALVKVTQKNVEKINTDISALNGYIQFPISNIQDWTSMYPDGFGRETNEEEGIATDVNLPIYTDKVSFTIKKLSPTVNINFNIRVNTSNSGSFTTILGTGLYDNTFIDGYLTAEFDIAKALKEKNIDVSSITNIYLRFMENSANFYGKFTLTELKYVTLDSLYNGKQDKQPGKGLSTNDFSNTYKEKLDSLENYDDTDIKSRLKALEELGLSSEEIENVIKAYLDEHPELITSVQDNSLTWNKFTSDTKRQIRNNVINVQDYGVKGDGVTDNYEALKSIFESLKENDTVYFPHGSYLIDFQGDIPITEADSQASDYRGIKRNPVCMAIKVPNVLIEGNNSQIKVAKTMFWEYQVFNVAPTGKNFIIKDLIMVGDYAEHIDTKFFYEDDKYYSHEFGYGVFVQANGLIRNCQISMMMGDAIVTKNSSDYNELTGSGSGGQIMIENCELFYCRRQGLSILDSDIIELKSSYIHHIGDIPTLGLIGKSPMGGIDLEPGSGTKHIIGLNIINSKIRHCPKSITNGDLLAVNVDYINITDSEIGTVNIGNEVFAKNVVFINDSNTVLFTVNNESLFVGCNVINELTESPNSISLPKMVKSSILDRGNIFPKVSISNGLFDCYLKGVNLSHEYGKGDIINTILDGCKLEHSDESESIIFNGCTVKDLIASDYITGTDTNHAFTADGLTFNKCLIINEPEFTKGNPTYIDTTKV